MVKCEFKEKMAGTGGNMVDISKDIGSVDDCIVACNKKGGNGVSVLNKGASDKCHCRFDQGGQVADLDWRNCKLEKGDPISFQL